MKRTAAILGPTPAFLSWTIARSCSLRRDDPRKPVDAAFRELRSLRAIAVGEIEQRVFEGFCLHPDAAETEVGEVKGFPVDEIYAAFGGQEPVCAECRGCEANVGISSAELESVGPNEYSKAGCFGWLPFGDHCGSANHFLRLLEAGAANRDHPGNGDHAACPVQAFQSAIDSSSQTNPFPVTSPAWYGVWSRSSFSQVELEFLAEVCASVRSGSLAWRRLAAAVDRAQRHNLTLHCQLMPAGYSDGLNWVIESQCVRCGAARDDSPCPVCSDDSKPTPVRKLKVLGLRPYLKLSTIIGAEGVATLVEQSRS